MAVGHENSNVVANACAALYDMSELGVTQSFNMKEASRLIIALNEWYSLRVLMFLVLNGDAAIFLKLL
jgi:hypothetical protein